MFNQAAGTIVAALSSKIKSSLTRTHGRSSVEHEGPAPIVASRTCSPRVWWKPRPHRTCQSCAPIERLTVITSPRCTFAARIPRLGQASKVSAICSLRPGTCRHTSTAAAAPQSSSQQDSLSPAADQLSHQLITTVPHVHSLVQRGRLCSHKWPTIGSGRQLMHACCDCVCMCCTCYFELVLSKFSHSHCHSHGWHMQSRRRRIGSGRQPVAGLACCVCLLCLYICNGPVRVTC